MKMTPALARALEQVEAEAWSDLYHAATPEDVRANGISMKTIDSASAMGAGRIDVLALNRVVGLGTAEPASDRGLDRIIQHYRECSAPRFFVHVHPKAEPASLSDTLRRRSFRHYNNWIKLHRDLEAPPEVDTHLRVERIGPEHDAAFARLVAPGFEWPKTVEPWLARLVGRPGWRHYAAFDGSEAVAAAAMYTTADNGYLSLAATHPDHRRRGAQSALIARRIRDAAALGCRRLITESAEDRPDHPAPSFHNLRRFGFEVAYARRNYLHETAVRPN